VYCLVNVLVIAPAGEFPINDDWVYSDSVRHLLEAGQLRLVGCSSACFLHVVFGALFCLPFGWSHVALRCETIFVAFLAAIGLYILLRQIDTKPAHAAMLALLLAANPIFVHLSYSFMTDICALMFATSFAVCTMSALKKKSLGLVVVASLMLCSAILVRQLWVLLIVCNFALILLPRGPSSKQRVAFAGLGIVIPVAVAVASQHWFASANEFTAVYASQKQQLMSLLHQLLFGNASVWWALITRSARIFSYFGLFCLPVVPAMIAQLVCDAKKRDRRVWVSLGVATLVVIASTAQALGVDHKLMPYSENLLRFPMVGPLDVMGICVGGLTGKQKLWLTLASAICSVPLMAVIFRAVLNALSCYFDQWFRRRDVPEADLEWRRSDVCTVLCASLFAASFCWVAVYTGIADFDRYYLSALPFVILCIGLYVREVPTKMILAASIVLLFFLAAYSTLAEQDFMSWNRARWQALGDLERFGVSALRIDGGYEYNYTVNPALLREVGQGTAYSFTHRGAYPRCNWRWWSVSGEDYVLSFSPLPGYYTVGWYPFFGALTMSERNMFILQRKWK
jgi:hypothetical protein